MAREGDPHALTALAVELRRRAAGLATPADVVAVVVELLTRPNDDGTTTFASPQTWVLDGKTPPANAAPVPPVIADAMARLHLASDGAPSASCFVQPDAKGGASIGLGARVPPGLAVVVVARSDVALAATELTAVDLLAVAAADALLGTDAARTALAEDELVKMRLVVLDRLATAQQSLLAEVARGWRNALTSIAADARRDVAAREAELVAHNEKLRRTQRAMLNVIDDLREARVEERTREVIDILDATQDSFFALDRELRIVLTNRRHDAMSHVPRAEALGRPYFELFPAPRTSKFWTEYHRVRDERVTSSFVEHFAPLGLWIEASASPSPDGGVVVFYRDVTARKRLEDEREELLAKERRARLEAEAARVQAESANRMKDQFLSTVSHELRTPLNAILGWAAMLRGERLDSTHRTTAIETIERNARAQVRLIEDLLDLGRILQGKFQMAVGPVEVVRVVQAAIEAVRPAADAKGVRIQQALDSHATIVGDAERVQQVAWNLLSNAIKFTPRGGRVHITLMKAPSFVELSVADTGEGIAPEFLPHVFEPFRQADGAISRRTGGLGLGLSIVRSLVELHGGTVTASSEGAGKGAVFTVRLPMAPIPAARSAPADGERISDPGPSLDGLRVLVVDDEEDTRDLIAFVLEHAGASVKTAASSADALAELARDRYDVMVSDVGMPEEDGITMIRRVRTLPADRGGRIPAVALTAYARSEDRAQALLAGFNMHLTKPVDPTELTVVISAVTRNDRAHSS